MVRFGGEGGLAVLPAGGAGWVDRRHLRMLCASIAGNTIEFYEFTVYATVAALAFTRLFFPSTTGLTGLLLTFGTFAIGFISRPLGGVFFGSLADRLGRKPVMIWTLWLMGGATFLIGLLPTYHMIGIAAPLCLTLLRFIQGFAIGGEWSSAVSLIFEHAPVHRRGFYGSLVQTGSGFGVLLSSLTVSALYHWLSPEEVLAWGWRIPFLISAILIILGLWARRNLGESPEFEEQRGGQQQEPSHPLRDTLTQHGRMVALSIGIYVSIAAIGFLTVFVISYSVENLHMRQETVLAHMLAGSLAYLVAIPLGGMISDLTGRLRSFFALSLLRVPVPILFFGLVDSGSSAAYLAAILLLQLLNGAVYGIQASLFSEMFPVEVRSTGLSLGFQIATVIGGGLTPMIASLLVAAARGQSWGVALYLTILCIATAACVRPLFRSSMT